MRYDILGSNLVALLLAIAVGCQQSYAQDFTELTALAQGALVGQNVNSPVAGFDVRVLRNGEVLYHQAFGDWSLDRPARADSSTKTLSGALMMSLAETGEGGFSLDSRLSDFLEAYDEAEYRDITIRQAFTHTSGFEGQDVTSLILMAPNITLQQAADWIQTKPLVNGPPGSTFAYGGLSMQAAGAAAEVATGESFLDLFDERIATPLGMTSTQFVAASETNPRVAGGAESTATDFARFMDMLLNDGVDRVTGTRVLQAASVVEMLTQQTNDSQPIANSPTDNHRYGIGTWVDQFSQFHPDGPTVDALAGGARGFHGWIDESHDLVFTFATDLTTFSNVEQLSSLMHRAILEAISEPGDFNFDGQVDGADYLLWQRGDSPSADDLADWQANYPTGPTQVVGRAVAVPEPRSKLLLLAGLLFLLRISRRRASTHVCG